MVSEEALIKIVNQILDGSFLNSYQFYLLLGAVVFLSVSLSSFLVSYMKQKGKSFATKADFDEISEQLRKTTILTEKIRSDIAAEFQEQNSLRHLTREKIESIIDQTYKLELWLEQSRSKALSAELPDTNESPMTKIEMYQAIYFKNSENELLNLRKSYFPMMEFIFELATNAANKEKFSISKFKELQKDFNTKLTEFRKSILDNYAAESGL